MAGLDFIRIQQGLVDLVEAGPYYGVTYTQDPSNKAKFKADTIDTDAATPVSPESVVANEVRSIFGPDERYGRAVRLSRDGWQWVVRVAFSQAVTAQAAERAWCQSPTVLPRDNEHDTQVTLYLAEAQYTHPTFAEGEGTQVDFVFEARLSRR